MIGEQNDVAFAIDHEAVAVFDRGFCAEYAPVGNDSVPKISLPENRRRGLGSEKWGVEGDGGACGGSLFFEETSAGDFHGRKRKERDGVGFLNSEIRVPEGGVFV